MTTSTIISVSIRSHVIPSIRIKNNLGKLVVGVQDVKLTKHNFFTFIFKHEFYIPRGHLEIHRKATPVLDETDSSREEIKSRKFSVFHKTEENIPFDDDNGSYYFFKTFLQFPKTFSKTKNVAERSFFYFLVCGHRPEALGFIRAVVVCGQRQISINLLFPLPRNLYPLQTAGPVSVLFWVNLHRFPSKMFCRPRP